MIFTKAFVALPEYIMHQTYDHLMYLYCNEKTIFNGWGIHLYVGRFGSGKTMTMCHDVYNECLKYPQLTIVTNLKLTNFPDYINILPLNTAQDILNAPVNSIIVIDEIGTIFNSRDFNTGKGAVPKSLFQFLCQCRKRKLTIYATVQRFNLLDKQIRDITADVTSCRCFAKHPFCRFNVCRVYDIDDYEMLMQNMNYPIRPVNSYAFIQRNHDRVLYDTTELIAGFLKKEYISDEEILRNRGEAAPPSWSDMDKNAKKQFKKRVKYF